MSARDTLRMLAVASLLSTSKGRRIPRGKKEFHKISDVMICKYIMVQYSTAQYSIV